VLLTLTKGGVGRQQILTLSQAPNCKSNDVNHAEPEFVSKEVNEMHVRLREANGRRLEFLVLHDS
jgi:hypothetical protein